MRYVSQWGWYSEVTHEHFIRFLEVEESTGQRMFDVLLLELWKLGLDVSDIHGQEYYNGANMIGIIEAYKVVFYN